mgnify:FL=1
MWHLSDDDTAPVITAQEQIHSAHRECTIHLPETAVVFFMGGATTYLEEKYNAVALPELFPCFLKRRPVWVMKDSQICFLEGGSGAPMAADTVETLAVLGVRRIIAVGMFGAFSSFIHQGEVIVPERAFVEEGTSLHYYDRIESAVPDADLYHFISSTINKRTHPIVSTDAVYRQTFRKEQLWRENGAVGVDMETSAVFSVSDYLGISAAAILMASDIHPLHPDAPKWAWLMTKDMKNALADQSISVARAVAEKQSLR